ncbi:Modification methylase MboII [Fusobacterium necrogenes]|uniref:Modification methylase MboII n=1 Tax=Fusobacterium necrogenes TaxID=858 RepID=A0A377GUV3_9FUSO|nr:site-specific DNA-methyltransferase [Fusobacterium necrogenes]STO30765.1 Modification methylase MboII [Fusobacterium necrogenes]
MLAKIVKDTLQQDERLIENDEFNMIKFFDLLEKYDTKILELLYQNEEIKNKFFLEINGINIFKQEEFKFFIQQQKPFKNGWTKLKNRIGLCDGKYFLQDTQDIVLNFPFKDCILEGGQSTDEGIDSYFNYEITEFKDQEKANKVELVGKETKVKVSARGKENYVISGFKEYKTKRKEIFFNEILAKDEIDRLLERKAFTGWKKYSETGEEIIENIRRDENGVIKENLIIKGNNLLALHSLKKEFNGKIKLIYIDPPYNTKNDSFAYNDNFNHSTWLTFMKNRLEVARELLREDGFICIQVDKNEVHYLKVLMDEIFDRENFIADISIKSSNISGNKTSHKEKTILKNKDNLLVYSKNYYNIYIQPQYIKKNDWDTHYNKFLVQYENKGKIEYRIESFKDILLANKIIDEKDKITPQSNQNELFNKFVFENRDKIFRFVNSISPELKKLSILNPNKIVEKYNEKTLKTEMAINGQRINKLEKTYNLVDGDLVQAQLIGDFWWDLDFQNTQNEGGKGVSLPNGQKPEKLMKRIIEMFTNKKDIILDFHLGSGTTCAVAHKLGRQYIGIEQMDYIESLSVQRLKNVIEGEQGGISKNINWQGGGEFLYLEFAKYNEEAKEKIKNCETSEELENLFDELYNKYYLNYNLNIKNFKKLIITSEYKNLSLDDKKKMYLSMLDLNSMYINYEDMEDDKFKLSDSDIKLTKQFYGGK